MGVPPGDTKAIIYFNISSSVTSSYTFTQLGGISYSNNKIYLICSGQANQLSQIVTLNLSPNPYSNVSITFDHIIYLEGTTSTIFKEDQYCFGCS